MSLFSTDLTTRHDLVAIVGEQNVLSLEAIDAHDTNRRIDGIAVFEATAECTDIHGDDITIICYYLQDADDVHNAEDLSDLDWVIYGYDFS